MARNQLDPRDFYGALRASLLEAVWTVGAKVTNTITASIQLNDGDGFAIGEMAVVDVFLSDSATGVGPAAAAPTGGWAAGTNGKLLGASVAGILGKWQSDGQGRIDVAVTQVGAKTYYAVCVLENGSMVVSGGLAF